MSESVMGGWRNLSILLLSLGCSFAAEQSAAWAESEASFAVGDSQATWGGWSSEARSCAGSEAQWGTSGSEASWGGSSEASSQAGSESGYGQPARYGGRRGYWRHYYRGGSTNAYDASGYERSQSSAMQRLKREQQEEQSHQADLAKMPDSSFVHTYGAATPGGVVDVWRKNYGGYGPGVGYGNTAGYGKNGGKSYAYGSTDAYSGRQRDVWQR